jgi:hypothetical protein
MAEIPIPLLDAVQRDIDTKAERAANTMLNSFTHVLHYELRKLGLSGNEARDECNALSDKYLPSVLQRQKNMMFNQCVANITNIEQTL